MNRLIIFDLDGVLLDSEKLYFDMNQDFFRRLGAKVSLEDHRKFVGISATTMWETIKSNSNLTQTVDQLKEMERDLKFKMLQDTRLVPTEGVGPFLDSLKKAGYNLAIASSSARKNIELILRKLDFQRYFDLVVSGEEVAKGKPEPDIFLKVSGHFKREPGDCVVIEDSKNGVWAAKAAGMICFGFINPNSGNQDLSQADFLFNDFKSPELYQRTGL